MNQLETDIITHLFSGTDHLYSLLWWTSPESTVINARSFIIDGKDSTVVFSSAAEAKAQIAGSGYEQELVGVEPGLLAAILQGREYATLNPGGDSPMQFKTSTLKQFTKIPPL